jgi:hypothetical protein
MKRRPTLPARLILYDLGSSETPADPDEPQLDLPQTAGMTAIHGDYRTGCRFEEADGMRTVQIRRPALAADMIDQHERKTSAACPAIGMLM